MGCSSMPPWHLPRLSLGTPARVALLVEAAWEITAAARRIINRDRAATIALDLYAAGQSGTFRVTISVPSSTVSPAAQPI